MAPDDEEEGGGGGPVIIDPNRSVNHDKELAEGLCARIQKAIDLTNRPGAQDGYAAIAAQRLEEALLWAKMHRAGFQ